MSGLRGQHRCYICGAPLEQSTEEEHEAAMAEARENYPEQDIDKLEAEDELGAVCDPCYREVMADLAANPEKYRRPE